VSEDEHLQLLSGEGILYNKVPKKCKKCNKTNDVSFKHSLNCGKPTENVTRRVPSRELTLTISGVFQQVDLMYLLFPNINVWVFFAAWLSFFENCFKSEQEGKRRANK
jgi:hypothetical protein